MYDQSTKHLTCTRKHYCFFVVRHVGTARLDTLVTHDFRLDSLDKVERVESCRVEPSGIWALDILANWRETASTATLRIVGQLRKIRWSCIVNR